MKNLYKFRLSPDEKLLVVSDLHVREEPKKSELEFIKKLLGKYDRIIINGDFWHESFYSFDNFIKSSWNELFPILIKKEASHICGNHDQTRKQHNNISLFCKTPQRAALWKAMEKSFILNMGTY